jgi:hypothetical protein
VRPDQPELRHFLETNLRRRFDAWHLPTWGFETLNLVTMHYNPSFEVVRADGCVAVGGHKKVTWQRIALGKLQVELRDARQQSSETGLFVSQGQAGFSSRTNDTCEIVSGVDRTPIKIKSPQ